LGFEAMLLRSREFSGTGKAWILAWIALRCDTHTTAGGVARQVTAAASPAQYPDRVPAILAVVRPPTDLAKYGEVERIWQILAASCGMLLTVTALYASPTGKVASGHLGSRCFVLRFCGTPFSRRLFFSDSRHILTI
jgi:hypothetical protein